jgi:NADPH:quinone reductase-like Zn-dependent oxidoreductase
MKAIRFHETGPPSVLRTDEVAKPEPGPRDVLVAVEACGINRADILARSGALPWPVPLPFTLGADIAGTVAEIGPEVEDLSVGQRVVVNPYIGCGHCRHCLAGRNNLCRKSVVLGLQIPGGYAELALAPAKDVLPLPDEVSFEAAAAVVLVGLTAWHLLVTQARLAPVDRVLVVAASSGVGSLGIQIAKSAGATVYTTVGSEAKRARAEELGADEVFLVDDPDLVKKLRRRTDGEGVDVVFEHVGAATWPTSVGALARGGRLAWCGGHSGFDVGIHLANISVKEQELIGSYGGTARELIDLMQALKQGLIEPVIHERYPFSEVAAAHTEMESRGHFGKLVLTKEA